MKTQTILDRIEELLKQKVAEGLNSEEQVAVEQPVSVETYVLSHPRGAYLVTLSIGNLADVQGDLIIDQDVDVYVTVIAKIRALDGRMKPAEYVDFVIKALSGNQLDPQLPRAEKSMYAKSFNLIDEKNGVWDYGITFFVPNHFTQELQ